jgi:hypothetical protein
MIVLMNRNGINLEVSMSFPCSAEIPKGTLKVLPDVKFMSIDQYWDFAVRMIPLRQQTFVRRTQVYDRAE